MLMRLTYTSILQAHFRNIGKSDMMSDATLLADFRYNLGQRYQLIFASLAEYINSQDATSSTVAGQQYYNYPVGIQTIDEVKITIGSVSYSLTTIYSQHEWNKLNSIPIQISAIPKYVFPRQYDFGIWPIPQSTYTITLNVFMRDRTPSIDDISSGTITLNNGSTEVSASGTPFTSNMVGRWLVVTSSSSNGQGYYYRLNSFVSSSLMTISQPWEGDTASGLSYIVGESPALPEESHILLPVGTAADYYLGLQNDPAQYDRFNNIFYTGDGSNSSRDLKNKSITGGLIGLVKRYSGRDRKTLINKSKYTPAMNKFWAQTISE